MTGPPGAVDWQRNRTFALIASLSAVSFGALALAGWLLHVEALKSIIPGAPPVKPNLALGMLLCGAASALLSRKTLPTPVRICAVSMAAIVVVLAVFTLAESLFDWNLGIEEWPVGGIPGALGASHPDRISPATALCFIVMGIALGAASGPIKTRLHLSIAEGLSGSVILIGLIALIWLLLEILFGARWSYMEMNVSGIPGAVGFMLLGSGLLLLLQSKSGRRWSLNILVTSGFAFGILLMVVAAAAAFNFTKQMLDTTAQLAHRQEALKEIQKVMVDIVDLGSRARVYIITGEDEFLKKREKTKTALHQDLLDVRNLTADNLNQQRSLDQLESLIAQRAEWEEQAIVVRHRDGFASAAQMVATGPEIGISENIHSLLTRMQDEEYRLLRQDRKQAETATTMAFLTLPLGVFLSLTLLSVSVYFLNVGAGERAKVERAARESEERYRKLFESIPNPMWVFDLETLRFLAVNAAAVEHYGYSQQEFLTMTVEKIRPPEGISVAMDDFSQKTDGGNRLTQCRHRKKDGALIDAEITSHELMWLGRSAKLMLVNDITERKRAEEESHLLQTITLAISEAKDFGGALGSVLRNVCELTGWLLGLAWIPRPDERVLECSTAWSEGEAGVGKFRALSRALTFPPGVDLPGRVWDSKQIAWIDDLTIDMNFPRAHAARESGLKAAVAIPVLANDEVISVIEFFVRQSRGEDERFVKVISSVVAQLGQVVHRKRLQESLRQAEQKYRAIFENAVDGIFQTTPEGEYISVNPALARMYGYESPKELVTSVHDIGHCVYVDPARRTEFKRLIEAQGFVEQFQYEVFRKDGRRIWLSENARAIRDANGAIAYYEGTVEDITERKQREDALRASEAQLRSLIEQAPAAIAMFNRKMICVAASRSWVASYGCGRSDIVGLSHYHLNPDMPERWREIHRQALAGEPQKCDEDLWIRADGSEHWLRWAVQPWTDTHGDIGGITILAENITDRKKAEERLREQAALFNQTYDAVLVWEWKGAITFWNRGAEKLYGFSAMEAIDLTPQKLLQTQVAEGSQSILESLDRDGAWEGEVLHTTKEGRCITVESRMVLVREANREYVLETNRDVTERKRAKEQLLEQADIINRAHDAIIIRNFEDERITFWNKGAESLYGWSAEEALGNRIGELVFADENDRKAPLEHLISTGEFHGELKQKAKDGREIAVATRATCICDARGEPRSVLLINTDVTEQKKLETQLRRAQRLESIGTLASGVAHDLNNILAPILMSAHTLRSARGDEDRQSLISMIEESAERGAGVVRQVLTFARGIEGERLPIKPNRLIQEMIDLARTTFPKSIETIGRCPESLWTVQGDPTQLHQVLLNLSVNARDAMPNGGRLTFGAENFTVDEPYAIMTPDAKAGPYVILRVSDTGTGMSRAVIDRIFDPFFTTKEVGKGTGLGLSTALGIVKSHGGFISVYSELGKGTTFNVFLPATIGEEVLRESGSALPLVKGHGEEILVVDDEPNILKITKMIFEQHNYRVLSARDGKEALDLFAQKMESIRIALTDIAMPHMDGVALVRALRKMKSDLPIIASTGQGEQASMAELQSLGVKDFLTKPYNTEKLLATVHETLQSCESSF